MKHSGVLALLADLVYPRRCVWCGNVLGFCKTPCACREERKRLCLPAHPLATPKDIFPWNLQAMYACYRYEEPVRGAVLRLKFEEEVALAAPLGQRLADIAKACGLHNSCDAIVPVPISVQTRRTRGYNQSQLLAQALARELGLPMPKDALRKLRHTRPQRSLEREERLENPRDAYRAYGELVRGRHILLVDDIKTTGSTLNHCAEALLAQGAESCTALCVTAVV